MSELVRFVVPAIIDDDSQTAAGVVQVAHDLIEEVGTAEEIRRELAAALDWLDDNLEVPDRFNRTKSKGWYRRQSRGISWLRSSATEHVATMQRLVDALTNAGYVVREIRTERAGYVTYEDAHQVVAEPFRDTPTK
jgi:hypothetical protein